MKNLSFVFALVAFVLTVVVFSGCTKDHPHSGYKHRDEQIAEVQKMFDGKHELRKMAGAHDVISSETKTEAHGSFFLIVGGASFSSDQKVEEKTTVTFAWKASDGAYNISTLPLDKIRVHLSESVSDSVPQISFRLYQFSFHRDCNCREQRRYYKGNDGDWNEYHGNKRYSQDDLFKIWVQEATVTCRSEDWPLNVTLPMNSEKTK